MIGYNAGREIQYMVRGAYMTEFWKTVSSNTHVIQCISVCFNDNINYQQFSAMNF